MCATIYCIGWASDASSLATQDVRENPVDNLYVAESSWSAGQETEQAVQVRNENHNARMMHMLWSIGTPPNVLVLQETHFKPLKRCGITECWSLAFGDAKWIVHNKAGGKICMVHLRMHLQSILECLGTINIKANKVQIVICLFVLCLWYIFRVCEACRIAKNAAYNW